MLISQAKPGFHFDLAIGCFCHNRYGNFTPTSLLVFERVDIQLIRQYARVSKNHLYTHKHMHWR